MAVEALSPEGMPTHAGDLSIEGRGIEPIPDDARYGSVGRIFTVWFTPNLVPAAFFIGTLAAADFLKIGFVTGVLAIIVGQRDRLDPGRHAGHHGTGDRHGPDATGPRRLREEHHRPGLLNWLSCIGWDGINSIFGAAALSLLTGMPFVVSLLIIVLLQAALGVIGYEAIHTFEKYMAVVLGAMFVVLTIASLARRARAGRTASPAWTSWAPSCCSRPSAPASCSRGRCTRRTTAGTCPRTRRASASSGSRQPR